MKHRLFVTFGALLMVATLTAWADGDDHSRSVGDVEQEIRRALGLSRDEQIDPDTVPDELLITLGDAVMGSYISDERQHEWMDRMMGGEGSESLDSARRWMGYRYLNGGYYEPGTGFGMMGSGMMMGPGMMHDGWGLMGNPDMAFDAIPYGSPEEILRRRYADGEISRREYRRMLRELE